MGEKKGHNRAMMVCSSSMNVLSSVFLAFMFLTWDSKDLPFLIGLAAVLVFLLVCPLLSVITTILFIKDHRNKVVGRMDRYFLVLALLYPMYLIIFLLKLSTFKLNIM